MPIKPKSAHDRLIVALDVAAPSEALTLVAALRDSVGMFKIGSQLFTAAGPSIVRQIVASGAQVFLDLKFHDIPHQVAGAARAATELGVSMFTLHASGGSEMMLRAVEGVIEIAEKKNIPRPAVLAVSVLTSIDEKGLSEIGVGSTPAETVVRLVRLAEKSGVDGVVASPQEVRAIRETISKRDFLVITPGVRPSKIASGKFHDLGRDDQKRVATAEQALSLGADYLVIGRPITGATDPAVAAKSILSEIENVLLRQRTGTV